MKNWIEMHKEKLWGWIDDCYNHHEVYYLGNRSKPDYICPLKQVCDVIWEIVKQPPKKEGR